MKPDYRNEMVNRSLISMGNNHRMKRAIKKAQKSDHTTIAYLGGSITMRKKELQDRGYADASFRFFEENIAHGGKLTYINSGMNGTGSMIGLMRLERDVLRFQPDIVFVEFSVNDSKDSIYREAFESLIVSLIESKSKPAVVLLFLQSEGGYSCQGHMQVVGEHYQLPMISVCDAIQAEIEAGRMKWSEYANDNIHPHAAGNDLIAEFVINYFKRVITQEEDEEVVFPQEPFFGTAYKNMKLLDSSNFNPLSIGGFKGDYTLRDFPNGWVSDGNTDNASFRLELNFKNLFIVYKASNNEAFGSISVFVDGKSISDISAYRIFGWNNPTAKLIYSGDVNKEHSVEIIMSKGDESKEFCILAFGYCEK